MQAWPTVIWEVAYCENEKKLACNLVRYVACSPGSLRVHLAIGVNIESDYAETFTTLEESVSQQSLYTILPDDPNGCTKMDILNRHLYCTSPAKDQNKPAITIPFSALRRVIISHDEQQSYLEISLNMKKHQYGEGTEEDEKDRKNKEDIAVEISRLNKPCIDL
ncbi:hypothetical protein BYT27DRAFT_7219552 [Phlegmacium glaucopus]|nr:hypothetical protein BYT27DRAFT_7219552 [Phlegmacium glaucopus]